MARSLVLILILFSSVTGRADSCSKLAQLFLKPFDTVHAEKQKILAQCADVCVAEDELNYYAYGQVDREIFQGKFSKSSALKDHRGTFTESAQSGRRYELILGPLMESINTRQYNSGILNRIFKPEFTEQACQTKEADFIPEGSARFVAQIDREKTIFQIRDLVWINKPGPFYGQMAAIRQIIQRDSSYEIRVTNQTIHYRANKDKDLAGGLPVTSEEIQPLTLGSSQALKGNDLVANQGAYQCASLGVNPRQVETDDFGFFNMLTVNIKTEGGQIKYSARDPGFEAINARIVKSESPLLLLTVGKKAPTKNLVCAPFQL